MDLEKSTVQLRDGTVACVAGLQAEVFIRLALIGAIATCDGRKDPAATWAKVQTGALWQTKAPPQSLEIRAYARARKTSVDEAAEIWAVMDDEARIAAKREVAFKIARLQLQAEALAVA